MRDRPLRTQPTRVLTGAVVACLVLALVAAALLWPRGRESRVRRFLGSPAVLVDAKVVGTSVVPCAQGWEANGQPCRADAVLISEGPDQGKTVVIESSQGPGTPDLEEGDRVVLNYVADAPPGSQYSFADYQRRAPLIWLAAVFAVAVVLLARMRGLRALIGLAVTMVVLVQFVLPAILDGRSPIAVAVVGAALIAVVNLYLAHGLNVRTTSAAVGTLASLAVVAVLAVAFVAATHLTGLASEEATFLQVASARVNLKGLLLGGVVIGALGALDDVTVTQASAVWELHVANPLLGGRRLYGAALRIGRDHIASTVNTLVLAYAGASLPLLILLVDSGRRVSDVLTGEVVAVEIVRTLVGSIGLVVSVPLTTALTVAAVTRRPASPSAPAAPSKL
jgi:uncharacterized membrane protein